MKAHGLRHLVDLASLAHLHTSRAYVPTQTNVIEASPDMSREGAKEWYYSVGEKDKHGPVSFQEVSS